MPYGVPFQMAWTSLDERALHNFGTATVDPGSWWACQCPERRPDGLMCIEFRCQRCVIAAQAYLANYGDLRALRFSAVSEGVASLSWCVERALRDRPWNR